MRRLHCVACFTCILSPTVTKLITTVKIKPCIKGVTSNGFVFQLYCLSTTEAFTIVVSALQADVTQRR